jgi:UDP-glucose 4-epimerase
VIENKKIFVTGGAGFIGSTVIKKLIDNNEIVAFDNLTRNTLKGLPKLLNHPNLTLIEGDVLDSDALTRSMKGADVVVHAAGIAGIDTVIKNPVKTMQVNMVGTANVLEAAHVNGVPDRVIDFSTSEVFGSMAFRSTEADVTVAG